ncbi:hypothetical protein EB118_22530, partial [bacterium]|nr:hypothetical protein [bacterium]
MPFSFPASPAVNDQSTQNGRTYSWSGYAWEIVATPAALPASVITSGTLDAARLPLATTLAAGAVIVGTGLGVSSGTVSVTYGTSSGTACQGNDSRLSDARTPTSHTQAATTVTVAAAYFQFSPAAANVEAALIAIDGALENKSDSAHAHGNITNAGAIGSTANLPVITTTSGVLTTGTFGTSANTF